MSCFFTALPGTAASNKKKIQPTSFVYLSITFFCTHNFIFRHTYFVIPSVIFSLAFQFCSFDFFNVEYSNLKPKRCCRLQLINELKHFETDHRNRKTNNTFQRKKKRERILYKIIKHLVVKCAAEPNWPTVSYFAPFKFVACALLPSVVTESHKWKCDSLHPMQHSRLAYSNELK